MRERKRARSEETSYQASNRSIELVKPYAEMGMSGQEILMAICFEKGLSFDTRHIGFGEIAGQARRRGIFRKLTEEELEDIYKSYNSSTKVPLEERVFKWLLTRAILLVEGVGMPNDRIEWKDMIAKQEKSGMLEGIISASRPLILRRAPPTDIVKIHTMPKIVAESNEEKSLEFVRRCLRESLIGDDLSKWKTLLNIYETSNMELPMDFLGKVRLEVFLSARLAAVRRDTKLLTLYKEIGEQIDPDWFDNSLATHEDFIAKIVRRPPKVGIDEIGAYSLDQDGRKWRVPVGIDDGNIIYSRSLPSRRGELTEAISRRAKNPYSSLS